MVRVPSYVSDEPLRGRNQQYVRDTTSADAFGASVGRGLQDLGKGMKSMADALDYRQALKDEADSRDALAKYRDRVRQEMYDPQSGYMLQTGSNAINGQRQDLHERLAGIREEMATDMTPRARRLFEQQATALDNSTKDTAIKHEGVELRGFTLDTFEASAQGHLDDAMLYANDQAKFNDSLQRARDEVIRAGRLVGDSDEVLKHKLGKLDASAHAGRVIALARNNPIEAFNYLEENKDTIGAEQYDKLYTALEPAYYGAQARVTLDSRGGTVGTVGDPDAEPLDWLQYNNQGAIRRQPISLQLKRAMGVLPKLGLGFEVTSGGQVSKAEGGVQGKSRTGGPRHDDGHAADGYFTKNGKRLSWANPGEQAIIVEALHALWAAGVTGVGAGPGYMGEGMVHVGFGPGAVWGENGLGENAPDWLKAAWADFQAGRSPANLQPSTAGMTLTEAMQIENPKLREAVIKEIEMRRNAQAADRAHRLDQAKNEAWSIIDKGGTAEDIPPDLQVAVGAQTMNTIFDTIERRALGVDTNDSELEEQLIDMAQDAPDEFAAINLNDLRAVLSEQAVSNLFKLQRSQRFDKEEKQKAIQNGTLIDDAEYKEAREEAAKVFNSFVPITGAKATNENKQRFNNMVHALWQGMEDFVKKEGRAMSWPERKNYIEILMSPAVIEGVDRAWIGDGDVRLFDAPFSSVRNPEIELLLDRVPPTDDNRIRSILKDKWRRDPTDDEVVEQYENELLLSMGVTPTIEASDIPKDIRSQLLAAYPQATPAQIVDLYRMTVLEAAAEGLGLGETE